MGQIIGARAAIARIEDHLRKALRAALAAGGQVAAAAEARIAPAVAEIDGATGVQDTAHEKEAELWATVLAIDAKSDTAIGMVRDAMWNALGRPRRSPVLEQVFWGA